MAPKKKKSYVCISRKGKAAAAEHIAGAPSHSATTRLLTLSDLPVELILEVCQYTDPLSVLHIARTSKTLRQLLMKKTNKAVWVRARELNGIPGPCDGLSEPQLASFMFEKGCQTPGCDNRQAKADYAFLVRLCTECRSRRNIDLPTMRHEWKKIPEKLILCIDWDKQWQQEKRELEEPEGDRCQTISRATYAKLKARFLNLRSWSDADVLGLRAQLTLEVDERNTQGEKIRMWLKRYENSENYYPGSVYAARDNQLTKRLVQSRPREYTTGLISDFKLYQHALWRECTHDAPQQLTLDEWHKMGPKLEKAIDVFRDGPMCSVKPPRRPL